MLPLGQDHKYFYEIESKSLLPDAVRYELLLSLGVPQAGFIQERVTQLMLRHRITYLSCKSKTATTYSHVAYKVRSAGDYLEIRLYTTAMAAFEVIRVVPRPRLQAFTHWLLGRF